MKIKILSLLSLLILMLTACQPAAVPEVVTQIETVVVTAVVEVEGEAMVLATPAATMAAPGGLALSDEPGNPGQLLASAPALRMVIKDAEMELLVRDTDQSLASVTQMTADYGGYLLSSQTWFDGGFKYASMRLAVPSASFETALNNLRIIGIQVLREAASGQDVSAEYVDLETRLANLEATAARVRAFLDAAQTVEESLQVSAELSELEGQIEQIKGQMRYYEGRTAFSTVTVYLTPDRPTPEPSPTPTATPGWSPGETFEQASGTLITVSQGAIDFLIWALVVLGPFVILFGIMVWGWRTARRKPSK